MSEASRPFLTAQWRNLLMFTYAVDPKLVIDRVPRGTTLDAWHGKALVSLIGFQFLDTKVLGAAVPFHQDFEEVNLRFYVRRSMGDEVRHGVVSIKELVPRPFVGGMARLLYREPYIVVPMRSKVRAAPAPVVEYQWNDVGRWCTIAAAADGEGKELAPGSLDEFITERHWGYNGEGRETLEYRVDHSPWHIWRVHSTRVDYEPVPLCGRELAGQLTTPISAILADGSAITVHWRNAIAA